ncbi:unnamed protein product [Adineta ricciae]|uniref:Cyclin A n=2 Tax=Adineta ricciae TaxID=249248 RepID=A0A813XRQ4_ADIRI|nr:unnamed protein product [Adineta ricciae]
MSVVFFYDNPTKRDDVLCYRCLYKRSSSKIRIMNSNRHVLRATHNRLPLTNVSSDKNFVSNKTKLCTSAAYQQQENCISAGSRPILTATRSIKKLLKENHDENQMLISPLVTTINKANVVPIQKQPVCQENKTREQLEQELFELPDYRQSIFEHLKAVEHVYAPKMNFMEHQSDINCAMRTILVDWLIEVADEYKLNDETLFLCIQYIDRFLSTVNVTRSKLQLLGTTCMYVASKYEEMYPPALEEFSFITDNTYETKHILRMEQILMKMLNFSISGPTYYTFMQYYLTCLKPSTSMNEHDNEYKCLSLLTNYLCTLVLLQDRPFSSYRSSLTAAACLFYANRILNKDAVWSNCHIQTTSYTQRDLAECVAAIDDLYSKTYQDRTTSSVLRRYLKSKKGNEDYECRFRSLIHHAPSTFMDHDDDDDGEILDLTLDDFDEENMSMEHHR